MSPVSFFNFLLGTAHTLPLHNSLIDHLQLLDSGEIITVTR